MLQETSTLDLSPSSGSASFSVLALGTGGGPLEDNLSAYWVKPAQRPWSDGFVSIDGGSCLGALTRLLASRPEAFSDFEIPASCQGSDLAKAGHIYGLLASFLVTHAHWDHISGLVLSCGSAPGSQKSVYGSKQTLANLAEAMNGGLWPVLGSYTEGQGVPYVWRLMETKKPVSPLPGLKATIWPVSHGRHHNNTSYESSAFFIENDETGRSFLIFGDVEADSVSGESTNRQIWEETALRISNNRLNTIFLECSYSSSRKREELYGHLSPPYIMEELLVLASYVPSLPEHAKENLQGRLSGVTICIIHVKDPTSHEELSPVPAAASSPGHPQKQATQKLATPLPSQPSSVVNTPRRRTRSAAKVDLVSNTQALQGGNIHSPMPPVGIRAKIYDELVALEAEARLGVRFVIVEQGMRIGKLLLTALLGSMLMIDEQTYRATVEPEEALIHAYLLLSNTVKGAAAAQLVLS